MDADLTLLVAAVVCPIARIGRILVQGERLAPGVILGHVITCSLLGYSVAAAMEWVWEGMPRTMLHVAAIFFGLSANELAYRFLGTVFGTDKWQGGQQKGGPSSGAR